MSDVIVGLDIGTSKIRAVISEYTENGTLQIVGVGQSPSTGLRKGVVLNIEATLRAINAAIEAAELMSGRDVKSCITAVGGSQIEGLNSRGIVAVAGKKNTNREITQEDMDRAIEAACAVLIPIDRHLLHVVTQNYIVDGQSGIKDPRDMIGVRLEVEVHIVTSSLTSTENVKNCVTRAGYVLEDIMLKGLSSVYSVMTEEEKELGSILIDMGGGTTDIIVLSEGAPVCSTSVPFGGISVTNDISIVKGISWETAERIKINAGCCWEDLLEEYQEVLIPGVGGRPPESITRKEICQIIQSRVEEIFTVVRDKVALQLKTKQLSGNIVLTGAAALMPGAVELASHVFGTTNVRIGVPGNLGGIGEDYRTPEFAVATGLILSHAQKKRVPSAQQRSQEIVDPPQNSGPGFLGKVKGFFKGAF